MCCHTNYHLLRAGGVLKNNSAGKHSQTHHDQSTPPVTYPRNDPHLAGATGAHLAGATGARIVDATSTRLSTTAQTIVSLVSTSLRCSRSCVVRSSIAGPSDERLPPQKKKYQQRQMSSTKKNRCLDTFCNKAKAHAFLLLSNISPHCHARNRVPRTFQTPTNLEELATTLGKIDRGSGWVSKSVSIQRRRCHLQAGVSVTFAFCTSHLDSSPSYPLYEARSCHLRSSRSCHLHSFRRPRWRSPWYHCRSWSLNFENTHKALLCCSRTHNVSAPHSRLHHSSTNSMSTTPLVVYHARKLKSAKSPRTSLLLT